MVSGAGPGAGGADEAVLVHVRGCAALLLASCLQVCVAIAPSEPLREALISVYVYVCEREALISVCVCV